MVNKNIRLNILSEQLPRAVTRIIYELVNKNIITTKDLQMVQEPIWFIETDGPNWTTEGINEVSLSLDLNFSDTLFEHQNFTFRGESVTEVSDVAIVGEYGVGVTKKGQYIEDLLTFSTSERTEGAIKNSLRRYPTLTVPALENGILGTRRDELQTIKVGCSLYNKWTNYYHWVFEHMLKLRHIERYINETGEHPTLIIPPDPPDYITESLILLGYSELDWIEWSGPGVQVESLVVPTYPEPTPGNLSWLRSEIRDNVNLEKKQSKRVYISRARTKTRSIENESEVVETVRDFGFERYFLEELSIEEQIKLFYNSDMVVSPHGAGLTNLVWGDDITVIELYNNKVYDLYSVLSAILGHTHYGVQFASVNPEMEIDADIRVDIPKLENCLESIVANP